MTDTPQTTDHPSKLYRSMIYFAVATLHFYREDIRAVLDPNEFMEVNRPAMNQVFKECLHYMDYELSTEQMRRAVISYLAKPASLKEAA